MNISINGVECRSLDDIRKVTTKAVADFIEEYYNDKDYIVAHTSGSTGSPKKIRLPKEDIKASAQLTNRFFGINENSILSLNLSPSYIAGKMMVVRALEAHAGIVEESPSNEPLRSYQGTESITLAAFVPSQLNYLINNPNKLDCIESMIIGGGKLSERVENWLADKGINGYKTYGMTETCSHVALSKVSRNKNPYEALGDVTFSVDGRNCLIINAPQFSFKKIVTNDVVELVDDRRFFWLGRFDNVVNTGGVKVYPEEVEHKIEKIIGHSRFFVTSRPSEKWGEELVLVLEYKSLKEGEVKEGDIKLDFIEKMKKLLPSYSVPRHYVAISRFKETNNGKMIRKI